MWVRAQWLCQAEIAKRILREGESKLSNKERAELEDIIKYVEELKQRPKPAIAVDFNERR